MTILALDSSGPVCSVALMRDGKIIAEAAQNNGLTHSQTLMPMLDGVLEAAAVAPGELELIACVAGPGSFTGVRIGVCAAKALAHAHNIPCAQLNALEVLAAGTFGFEGVVCPILDARRGQVYGAGFQCVQGDVPVRLMDDAALPLDAYMERLPKKERLLFVGDGVFVHGDRVLATLGERALIAPPHRSQLSAATACVLAAAGAGVRTDYLGLMPLYLRQSQAERERLANEGKRVE